MKNDFVMIFHGSMIYSNRIINELISNKINPIIKNVNESARLAGFGMINEQKIKIYVHLDEIVISKKIIKNLRI